MLSYVKDDLFTTPAHVLVNTVNTVGAMGKGIAKAFKSLYPDMFAKYQMLCEQNKIDVGKLWLYKTSNKWILNFPTKKSWRSPSKIEYIEKGLSTFVDNYAELGITSVAFPPLGCGNGELNWESQVRPLMEKFLKDLPIDIFIYLYNRSEIESPEHKNIKMIEKWLRSEPRSLSFEEVWEDIKHIIVSDRFNQKEVNYLLSKVIDFNSNEEIEAINIANKANTVLISKNEWFEIWSIIRNYGFITKRLIPNGFEEYFGEIVQLLLQLPYCRQVNMSKKYSDLNTNGIGVQIDEIKLPETNSQQLTLQF
jgi:O-acetyl-ADP-ribose deacetylase (regulator of RNase III)